MKNAVIKEKEIPYDIKLSNYEKKVLKSYGFKILEKNKVHSIAKSEIFEVKKLSYGTVNAYLLNDGSDNKEFKTFTDLSRHLKSFK